MCKAKPGPRCSQHSAGALVKANTRLETATANYEGAVNSGDADWFVQRRKDQLANAQTRYAVAMLDHDASPRGKAALAQQMNDESLSRDDRAEARKRLDWATAYARDLNAQKEHMPPQPPREHPARKAHTKLGQARSELAQARALNHGQDAEVKAEAAVLAADLRYSQLAYGGRPASDHLTPDERSQAQRAKGDARAGWAMLSYARAAQSRGGHNTNLTEAFIANKERDLGVREVEDNAEDVLPTVPASSGTRIPKTQPAAQPTTPGRPQPPKSARQPQGGKRPARAGRRSPQARDRLFNKLGREVEKSVKSHLEVQPGKYL